jgi:uncharacterized DUF497 family protein
VLAKGQQRRQITMQYEWDEKKRLSTLQERRLDFRDAPRLFDGRPLYTYASPRGEELRWVSVGLLAIWLIALVWMDRDGVRRIISMRRARDGEERQFRALFG